MSDRVDVPSESGAAVDEAGETSDPGVRRLINERGFRAGDDRSRVEAYQRRWQMPLDLLAMVTIWFVVVPAGDITNRPAVYLVLVGLRLTLSAVYATDIIVRTCLAPRHLFYLRHNLLSVATVFFPFLRVAFSLRLIRSIFQRGNIGRFVLAAGLMFLNLTAVVYLFERRAPHGNIKTVGNALWWAVVTLTTVGYGDYTPVTWQGRLAAALLMFVGFSVLATVTAQISSAFIDQAARARAKESGGTKSATSQQEVQLLAIADQLSRLEEQVRGTSPSS
ncbi:MAG: potassium channel family protein [Acidimicrobiales bacterium]